MKSPLLELLPLPRYYRMLKQEMHFPPGCSLTLERPSGFLSPALQRLSDLWAELGIRLLPQEAAPPLDEALESDDFVSSAGAAGEASASSAQIEELFLRLVLEDQSEQHPEAYQLLLEPAGMHLKANSTAGLNHGIYTLMQWIRARMEPGSGGLQVLRCLEVEDEPSFAERGVMLDISRDRVPTMETLFGLVEELAALKYNRLQLYTEHTFAYPSYPEVWAGTSAMEPEELGLLDAHCSLHGIELVPNQQSFGHMHHWLTHPRLAPLAECPEGIQHPFSEAPEPFGLCAVDPGSLEFLGGLYDELLPNFSSLTLNVGGDETLDLGQGRSAQACASKGIGRVYLDFLVGIHGLLLARGRGMQFWADIILNYPELVQELPSELPGATAMLWGYEAEHPFEEETKLVAASGLDFYVCPGTSSWQSLAGRLENMTGNLASAARHGQAQGAKGFLVTDWGDRGHLQPFSSCFPAWAMGSDLSWNHEAPAERHSPAGLTQLLAQHFLKDPTAASALAMVTLAQVSATVGAPWHNASPLSLLLTKAPEPFPCEELEALTDSGLLAADQQIDQALETLLLHQMGCPNAAQVHAELNWTANLLKFAIQLGLARLAAPPRHVLKDLPPEIRRQLGAELAPLVEEHARLWCTHHRPGGLARSSKWLERIQTELNGEMEK